MTTKQVEVEKAATTLKLLGDKTRLSMVHILVNHECCVCEFVELFQMSQPAISQHLRKLKDVGLVKETRRGQWVFYSINKQSDVYPLLQSILEHIPNPGFQLKELEKKGLRIICE
ncbi:ArsR/SmtB family transcription factor [Salirhabdus sp. Marseille-P4669]|uniref:ArsR/SmtB family transcription factor n=1 Tax=Salirhabdus sp. Marseille-P4669 TaxID=2042310 RepID=UPI000C799B46|nr:metalloregulator ArsR/SmtB family transcription factor [Salirhabdus sp. Marseille-P4669]